MSDPNPPGWRPEWKRRAKGEKSKRAQRKAAEVPEGFQVEEEQLSEQLSLDTGLPKELCLTAIRSGMEARSGWTLAVAAMHLNTEMAMSDIRLASHIGLKDARQPPSRTNIHPDLLGDPSSKEFKDRLAAYYKVRETASRALTAATKAAHTAVVFKILDNQQQGVKRARICGPQKAGESGAALGDLGRTFDYEEGPGDGDGDDVGPDGEPLAGDVLDRAQQLEQEESKPGRRRDYPDGVSRFWEETIEGDAAKVKQGVDELRGMDAAVGGES